MNTQKIKTQIRNLIDLTIEVCDTTPHKASINICPSTDMIELTVFENCDRNACFYFFCFANSSNEVKTSKERTLGELRAILKGYLKGDKRNAA